MATRTLTRRKSSLQIRGRDLQSIIQCVICMDLPETPKLLPCGHMFCLQCLEHMHFQETGQRTYSQTRIRCPNCRKMSDVPSGGLRCLGTDYRVVHLMEAMQQAQNRRRSSSRTDSEDLDPIPEEPLPSEPISDADFYNWDPKPAADATTESQPIPEPTPVGIPHPDQGTEPTLVGLLHPDQGEEPTLVGLPHRDQGGAAQYEMETSTSLPQESQIYEPFLSTTEYINHPFISTIEQGILNVEPETEREEVSVTEETVEQMEDNNEPQQIPIRESLSDDSAFIETPETDQDEVEQNRDVALTVNARRQNYQRQRSVNKDVNNEIICGLAFFVHEQLRERQCNALTVFLLEMLQEDRKRLLEQWADQKTALFYAVELRLTRDIVDLFLRECRADIEQYSMYDDGIHDKKVFATALIGAAFFGNSPATHALIYRGADINHMTADIGMTALIAACSKGSDNLDIIKYLMDKGADVNIASSDKRTCLMASVDSDPSGDICILLLNRGANVNAQDAKGLTALHEAARKGKNSIVKAILDHGADVNLKDKLGVTAFHRAVSHGCTDIVRCFLDHETDVNQLTNNGDTALHIATKKGHIEILTLLLTKGSLVDIQNQDGHTALIDAVINGQKEAVYELLKHGADSSLRDKRGLSATNLTRDLDILNVLRELRMAQYNTRLPHSRGDIRSAVNRLSWYRP